MNNYNNTADNTGIFFIICLVIIVLFAILNYYIKVNKEIKYIKLEMKRSTGREYKHWKRELKRLYLRSLPLIGRFFK